MSLACSLMLASEARADCVTPDQASPQSTCVVMERDGVRGVWFSLAEADALRRMKLREPELDLQIRSLEQMRDVQAGRVEQYREASTLRGEALARAEEQLELSLQRNTELEMEVNAWYRSPALWAGVGAAVTVAVVVAAR